MSEDPELVQNLTLSGGIHCERYSDGSSRYTGEGGGILWYLDETEAIVVGGLASDGFDGLDFLMLARERLLEVTKEGRHLFPFGNVDAGDPDTWRVLSNFKGELQLLVQALLKLDASFFRALAEKMKPTPSKAREAAKRLASADKSDDEIFHAIATAARLARGLPTFPQVLAEYRNPQEPIRARTPHPDETSSQFRDKIARRGFGWLYRDAS